MLNIFCLNGFFAVLLSHSTFATIVLSQIKMRIPKEHDIGLIFDLTVENSVVKRKEMLEFQVYADGPCCLNLTKKEMMHDANTVLGGHFGSIDAGTCKTVSLIWPTVSLYNRVGRCPIVITSRNVRNDEKHIHHGITFDTRISTLDPDSNSLRKRKDYKDCDNWDLEYFKNCTPVDCEERYFGRRSFYNRQTQRCERTACCGSGGNKVYDFYANECIDLDNFISDADLEDIKSGKFENNMLDFGYSSNNSDGHSTEFNDDPFRVINEITDPFMHDGIGRTAQPAHEKFVFPREAPKEDAAAAQDNTSSLPYWLQGMLNGLLIVFATFVIYIIVCGLILLVVHCVSRRDANRCLAMAMKHTPDLPPDALHIKSSSLISRR